MVHCDICENEGVDTPALYFAVVHQSGEHSGLLLDDYVCQEHANKLEAVIRRDKAAGLPRTLTIRKVVE